MANLRRRRMTGISILGLTEGAEKIGLLAVSYKGTVDDLKKYMSKNKEPVILHLKRNHFVVMVSSKKMVS